MSIAKEDPYEQEPGSVRLVHFQHSIQSVKRFPQSGQSSQNIARECLGFRLCALFGVIWGPHFQPPNMSASDA